MTTVKFADSGSRFKDLCPEVIEAGSDYVRLSYVWEVWQFAAYHFAKLAQEIREFKNLAGKKIITLIQAV